MRVREKKRERESECGGDGGERERGVKRGTHGLRLLRCGSHAVFVGCVRLWVLCVRGREGDERMGWLEREIEREFECMGSFLHL